MRRLLYGALVWGVAALPAMAGSLILEEVIARGMSSDAAVVEATRAHALAQAARREVDAGYWPQLRLSVGAGGTNNLTSLMSPSGTQTNQNLANLLSASGNAYGTSRLSLSQVLLDPALWTSHDLAELTASEEDLKLAEARRQAGFDAAIAHLAIGVAQSRLLAAQAGEELAQERLRTASYRLGRGLVPVGEEVRARQAHLESQHARYQAERALRQARLRLAARLDLELGALGAWATPSAVPWTVPPRSQALELALAGRTDLRLATLAVEREARLRQAEGASAWPALYLAVSAGAVSTTAGSGVYPDANAAAGASWNLFDGMRGQARREQAELRLARQEAAAARLRREVRDELQEQQEAADGAQEALTLAMRQEEVARGYQDESRIRAARGGGTLGEVREAELAFRVARHETRACQFEAWQAQARVARSVGLRPRAAL